MFFVWKRIIVDADRIFDPLVFMRASGNSSSVVDELFEAVWGEKYLHNNNTVMAHIGRLREKMNDSAKKAKFIVNRWGVGYIIES